VVLKDNSLPELDIKVLIARNPGFPLSTVESEIRRGLPVNSLDPTLDETLLMYAARTGNLNMVKLLHKNLANLEFTNKKGENAYMVACKHEKLKIADFFVF
jgi:ankyrin repeat protein